MNASCKIITRDVVVLGTIAATIILSGKQITLAVFNTFGFIDDINPNMGWVFFGLAAIWLVCRFMGKYKNLDHPFFYVSFIYWFFFFFVGIFTSWGLDITMAAITTPFIYTRIQWLLSCNKAKTNTSIFKYDHFDDSQQLHEGRTEMVNLITTEVKKLYNEEHSFTIGLEGGWGSGKSTLLNAVIAKLKGDNDDHGLRIEVVEFSPWAFPDEKNLSVEFLYEIRRVLIKHSFRARFVVNSYINVLTGSYSLGSLRMLTSLLFPRESLTYVKRKLSEIICHHKLKLVVVIDDLDRLNKDEIAEVFKMLRNTGELANSVYMVAYDKINIEKDENGFAKGFMDKVINVEVDLNRFNSKVLFEMFLIKLQPKLTKLGYTLNDNGVCCIRDLNNLEIINWIKNERLVLKLLNSISYKLNLYKKLGISEKIKISNLIIIELAKLKEYSTYKNLHCLKQSLKNKNDENDNKTNTLINAISNEKNLRSTWLQFLTTDLDYYLLENSEQVNIMDIIDDDADTVDLTDLLTKYESSSENFELIVRRLRVFLMRKIEAPYRICQIIKNEKYFRELNNDIINYFENKENTQILIPSIPSSDHLCLLDKTIINIHKKASTLKLLNKSDKNFINLASAPCDIELYFAERINNTDLNFNLAYQLLVNLHNRKIIDTNSKLFLDSFTKSLSKYITHNSDIFSIIYAFDLNTNERKIELSTNKLLSIYCHKEMDIFNSKNDIMKYSIIKNYKDVSDIFNFAEKPKLLTRQLLEKESLGNGQFFEYISPLS